MSLRTRVLTVLAAAVALTVASSSVVAVVVLDRRATKMDRQQARAFDAVSTAMARRGSGAPSGPPRAEALPGVIRPSEAVRSGRTGAIVAIVGGGIAGGLLAVAFGAYLAARLRRPVDDLRAAASAIGAGDFAHRIAPSGPPELRELADGFNGMAAAIERTDGERRAWLDELAHELRTPVGVIQAYAEALADDVVSGPAQRAAAQQAVATNAAQCAALLDALRAEREEQRPVRGFVDVAACLAGAVHRLAPRASAAGVQVETVPASGELLATGDRLHLDRVIDNLVDNAIRAAAPRGRVRLAARRDGTAVRLTVADDGPGIAAEDRVRAFDRLWRGDAARRRDGGQGLGLAIARRLVERAGGTIRIGDAPLGGALLEVRLPAAGAFDEPFAGSRQTTDVSRR
jgi:two-component system, OmpR family, sensor histidine kinase BaeS